MRRFVLATITAVALTACAATPTTTVEPIQFPDAGVEVNPDGGNEQGNDTNGNVVGEAPGGSDSDGDFENVGGKIKLVVDGWSKLSMADGVLQWSVAGRAGSTPVALRVASLSEVEEIAAKDPRIIEQLMARTVTADPTLRCINTGCETDDGAIPLSMLVDLRTSPVLGASYAAWGVEHGVWIGDVPEREAVLTYGRTSITIALQEAIDDDYIPADVEETSESGIRAIGVSLGAVFPLYAEWLGGERLFSSGARGGIEVGDDPASVDPKLAFQGLGTPMSGIEGLGMGHLMWRTSPTTGCGAGIGCVPGSTTSEVRIIEQRRVPVCSGELRSYVEFVSLDAKITYAQPTHQFGMWSGLKPDGAFGTRENVMWITAAPLVSGATHQHHAIVYLYDAEGLADMVARISDHAVDGEEDVTFRYQETDLSRFFGGAWAVCED